MTNPTYHQTVVASPQWKAWEKVAHEHGFDWHESVECGWLSPEHFQAFLAWVKTHEVYEYINRGQFSTPENPCEAWEKLNLRDKAEIVWHLLKALDK